MELRDATADDVDLLLDMLLEAFTWDGTARFTRADVEAALAGAAGAAFIAPPRFAIARTLIDRWVDKAT